MVRDWGHSVSPILGIWASQNYPRITNSYESIATVTVGGTSQGTITFSSIPSTYKHLQIRFTGRVNVASDYGQSVNVRFNSDTGSNYARHTLAAYTGGYAATTGSNDINQNNINLFGGLSSANWPSQTRGGGVIDILDYQNTNKFKTVRCFGGSESNSDTPLVSILGLSSGLWRSTSAVTSIDLTSNADFMQYSHFALYGIRG